MGEGEGGEEGKWEKKDKEWCVVFRVGLGRIGESICGVSF